MGLGCSLSVRTSSVGDRESPLNLEGGRVLGQLGWSMSVSVLNSSVNHEIIEIFARSAGEHCPACSWEKGGTGSEHLRRT